MQFTVTTPQRLALVDITDQVNAALARSAVKDGLCNLFTTHTTAALVIVENWDPDVAADLLHHLEKLVPRDGDFRHAEGNAQAHILSALYGVSLTVPIRDGQLALGRWQGVMLAEFDGPRERHVLVTTLGALPS
ncbi:MAG TPA: secondary thiamine-phosphate synthase enzyme YjbQ [Candidatus Binataceae bacterium]|jgi:secondary thiamine-phosphate synthase enzyme|nr:secondary thiamine-phosphate synthase enzyme YjbQ [Candidatus Binataceae bacterium]